MEVGHWYIFRVAAVDAGAVRIAGGIARTRRNSWVSGDRSLGVWSGQRTSINGLFKLVNTERATLPFRSLLTPDEHKNDRVPLAVVCVAVLLILS